MPQKRGIIVVLALLLGVLFLGAQLHFCTDFGSGPTGTHLCPVCSAVACAAVPSGPVIVFIPSATRLELPPSLDLSVANFSLSVSPRAPPVS